MWWLMIGISIAFCLLCATVQKLFVAHWSSAMGFCFAAPIVWRGGAAEPLLWRSSLWISSLSIFCGHTLHKAVHQSHHSISLRNQLASICLPASSLQMRPSCHFPTRPTLSLSKLTLSQSFFLHNYSLTSIHLPIRNESNWGILIHWDVGISTRSLVYCCCCS